MRKKRLGLLNMGFLTILCSVMLFLSFGKNIIQGKVILAGTDNNIVINNELGNKIDQLTANDEDKFVIQVHDLNVDDHRLKLKLPTGVSLDKSETLSRNHINNNVVVNDNEGIINIDFGNNIGKRQGNIAYIVLKSKSNKEQNIQVITSRNNNNYASNIVSLRPRTTFLIKNVNEE